MAFRVSLDGDDVVSSKLMKFSKATDDQVAEALLASSLIVVNKAKSKCPVRTGNLRRSIHEERTGPREVDIGTDVHYGPYVELGTARMAGKAFLRPALFESKGKIDQRFTVALDNAMRSVSIGR